MLYSYAIKAMDVKRDETALLDLLRMQDETAFTQLVEQHHTSLVRLARLFVQDEAVAQELSQETWLAVLQGVENFEGRSSLKTWIFTILINKAKTRSRQDSRLSVFSDYPEFDPDSPTVAAERFKDASAEKWANHWVAASSPGDWSNLPEQLFLSQETMQLIHQTIDQLPEKQRMVIILRDIDQMTSEEVCNILSISETNQRVLLHRARAKVRQALEDYLQLEH